MVNQKDIIYLTVFTIAMLLILSLTTIPELIFFNALKVSAAALFSIYLLYSCIDKETKTINVCAD